jgi:hypothetical protein
VCVCVSVCVCERMCVSKCVRVGLFIESQVPSHCLWFISASSYARKVMQKSELAKTLCVSTTAKRAF